jgi:signal transduction histidine kinase
MSSVASLDLPFTVACAALFGGVTLLVRRSRSLNARFNSMGRPMHELRGSLTALELCFSALDRPHIPERRKASVDALRSQVERARLALLDLDACLHHAARPGAFDQAGMFDLRAVVLRSARAWSGMASSYGAQLEAEWRAGPVRLAGDPRRLGQALDNLIANALEHGGGRVTVLGERSTGVVRITISDEGAGLPLPPGALSEAAPQRRRGHGLAIARAVIEAHGGRLAASRRIGGAALTIELPVDRPQVTATKACELEALPRRVEVDSSAPHAA